MPSKLMFRIMPFIALGLASTLVANSALAAPAVSINNNVLVDATSTPGYLTDRFSLSLGTFVVGNNLKSTLNGAATGSNLPVDFGHTFDTNRDHPRIRADALWRINPKHRLRFVYFNNDVTHSKTLTKDFAWGDYTFLANGSVSAQTKFSVYELNYEYAFVRRPTFELDAGAGIHMLDMSIKLAGQATFTEPNGKVLAASFSTKNSNLPAPLPVLGARATWAVTPTIFIEPEVQWLKINYNAYNGDWWDLRMAAKWMFSRHFGVGLGYDYFHLSAGVNKANFNGNLTLGYSGLQAMLVGSY